MIHQRPTSIFISYRRQDTGALSNNNVADNIYLRLKAAFGEDVVFMDTGSIRAGELWEDKILTHLQKALVVLVLIGKDFLCKNEKDQIRLYLEDDWVRRELEYALQQPGVTTISILVDRDKLPTDAELTLVPIIQQHLPKRQYYPLISSKQIDISLSRLIHEDLPNLGILPLNPGESKIQSVNRNVLKKAPSLSFLQRWCFRFLSKQKKQKLAFQLAGLFDNNEIDLFCNSLNNFIPLFYKDKNNASTNFINGFFRELNNRQNNHKFYLLLGETGTGKTTALAKLFTQFALTRSSYKIIFAQFGKDLRQVYKVKQKEKTILLLDGIDEIGGSMEETDAIFTEVEQNTKDFAKVVISCRTQFFESQAAERSKTNTNPSNTYQKIYIQFLEEPAVRTQLEKLYGLNEKYRLALSIVRQSSEHFKRPLLLAFMQDIIEHSSDFLFFNKHRESIEPTITLFEVYNNIIHQWLQREKASVQHFKVDYNRRLYDTSLQLAFYLYQRERKDGARHIYYVDLKKLPQVLNLQIDEYHLRDRSLLHRNEKGYYRFAHRTFKEFFYALLLYDGYIDETGFPFNIYEDAARFYREMCIIRFFRNQPEEQRNTYLPNENEMPAITSCLAVNTFAQLTVLGSNPPVFEIYRHFTKEIDDTTEHFDALVECADYLIKQEKDIIPEQTLSDICETYRISVADLLQYSFFEHDQGEHAFRFLHRTFAEFLCLEEMMLENPTDAIESIAAFPFEKLRFKHVFTNEIKFLRLRQHTHTVQLLTDNDAVSNEDFSYKSSGRPGFTYLDYMRESAQLDSDTIFTYLNRLKLTATLKIHFNDARILTDIPYAELVKHLDIAHNAITTAINLKSFSRLETLTISGNPGLEIAQSEFPASLEHIIYAEEQGVIPHLDRMKSSFPNILISPNGNSTFSLMHTSFQEPEMVEVRGGTFWMGGDEEAGADNHPAHLVKLSDYRIGKYPVTMQEFACFVQETGYVTTAEQEGFAFAAIWQENTLIFYLKTGCNWRHDVYGKPATNDMARHPVVFISWFDAIAYCQWLSKKTGKSYRLPTEAEWEYAAIGGQESGLKDAHGHIQRRYPYAGSDNLGEVAWHFDSFKGMSHNRYSTKKVGQLNDNQLAIYDMSGNVWEWCGDWYDENYYQNFQNSVAENPRGPENGSFRVLRGGSWNYVVSNCRVAFRNGNNPGFRNVDIGFRLVQDSF